MVTENTEKSQRTQRNREIALDKRLAARQQLYFALLLSLLLTLVACASPPNEPTREERPEFATHFEQQGVAGSFILYDQNNHHFIEVNPERNETPFLPASTFKILNSLIGLETAVIPDENHLIEWSGEIYGFDSWNQDHTLKTALPNSVVWYYQELARRVGTKQMQQYVTLADYGNADISGNIDTFWLDGGLRITPAEQIDFLHRFYQEELPFEPQHLQLVKALLIVEETDSYRLSAKTGFALRPTPKIGWWVGYLEANDNVYYFATNIESNDPNPTFQPAREAITRAILEELELI